MNRTTLRISALALASLAAAVSVGQVTLAADDGGGRAGFWKKSAQGSPQLSVVKRRVEKDPGDPVAQNDLGWALRQAGDARGAEAALREAVKLKPDLSQAHSNLSVVLLDKRELDESLVEARKAVELDPKSPIFRVVLGNALAEKGDWKKAADEYKLATTFRPDYQNAHYHLGRALYQDGQLLAAKEELAAALQLDPNDGRTLKLLDKLIEETGAVPGK